MDSKDLVRAIKKAAIDAVMASKPVAITYGKVISGNPLSIQIDQKLNLDADLLIISEHLTDRDVQMTINGIDVTCTVHNALQAGDRVIMLRTDGGQAYIVLDRIGG